MRIAILGEFSIIHGSGYTTVIRGLGSGLGRRGHEVAVLGFNYKNQEHHLPLAAMPAEPETILPQVQRLVLTWRPDVIVGMADITHHVTWQRISDFGVPYAGVFPLESDPLLYPSEWTQVIDRMGAALVETAWGTAECVEAGLRARHIPIGVDSAFWRPPTAEERQAAREKLGVADRWVVVAVGDNHERKNMPALLATIALLAGKSINWPPADPLDIMEPVAEWPDVCLLLNTKRRVDYVGYSLWNLAERFDISNEAIFLQHDRAGGLGDAGLRDLYWAGDAFMMLPKAEGLGLPFMEAMACGLPCVGTDTGGIAENLGERRGWVVRPEYSYIDPFGNQTRRFASPRHAAEALVDVRYGADTQERVGRALEWALSRTWDRAVDVLEEALNEIVQEKAKPATAEPQPPVA
jgi:glycosyltransferase involved in cell wall biosynthesis